MDTLTSSPLPPHSEDVEPSLRRNSAGQGSGCGGPGRYGEDGRGLLDLTQRRKMGTSGHLRRFAARAKLRKPQFGILKVSWRAASIFRTPRVENTWEKRLKVCCAVIRQQRPKCHILPTGRDGLIRTINRLRSGILRRCFCRVAKGTKHRPCRGESPSFYTFLRLAPP